MDDPKVNLLIKARGADGELLHPGLTDDPMDLIAACDYQGWGFHWFTERLWLFENEAADGDLTMADDSHIKSDGDNFFVALTDAVFQATLPVADNLERCPDHYTGWLQGASKEVALKPGEPCHHCGLIDEQGYIIQEQEKHDG